MWTETCDTFCSLWRKPTSFHGRHTAHIISPRPSRVGNTKEAISEFLRISEVKMRDTRLPVVSNALLTSSSLQEPRRAGGVCNTDTEGEREKASVGNRRVVDWRRKQQMEGNIDKNQKKASSSRLLSFFPAKEKKKWSEKRRNVHVDQRRSVEERTKMIYRGKHSTRLYVKRTLFRATRRMFHEEK